MNECRHFRIKGIHQLIAALDNRNVKPKLAKILSKLQTDKATTCKYSTLGLMLIDIGFDA